MTATSRPVRALFCIPNLNGGGAEKTVLNLVKALDRSRVTPVVFAHERRGSLVDTLDESVEISYYKVGRYRRTSLPGLLRETLRLAATCDVVVGANEGRATFLANVAAAALRKPMVGWLHNDWRELRKLVSWRQRLALRFYTRMTALVSASDGVGEGFRSLVPVDPARLSTIYNGTLLDEVARLADAQLDPEHEALFDESQPSLLAVGRLEHQKGYDLLLEAHAALVKRGLRHRLVVIGDGSLKGELAAQVARLNLSSSVHFLGFQKNPYRFMKRCTAFVLASRFEGFGMVLAEALACGAAVLSTDCPSGPAEILAGGQHGLLVEPNDANALSAGLARLLGEPELRARFRAGSHDRAAAFAMTRVASEWETLLERLARA